MSIILSYDACNTRIVWLMNRMLIFLYIRLEPKVNNVTSKCIQWSHNAFNADWIRDTYIIGLQRKWIFYPGPIKGVWGFNPGHILYTLRLQIKKYGVRLLRIKIYKPHNIFYSLIFILQTISFKSIVKWC